jgi:anti-sigma factor RsiW
MSEQAFSERDLHLALDGELPAERLPDFNAWLESNPEMKVKAARFNADRQRLSTALGPVAYEAVPARLTTAILGNGSPASGLSAWWRGAIAAGLVAAALGVGYWLGANGLPGPLPAAGQTAAERAASAHRIYAAEKLHVVEVGADQKDHLIGWLSRRVGTELVAPDLTAEGYDLVGGRLLPSGEKVAAQFMYQDYAGNRVSLYITSTAAGGETGFRQFEHDGARIFYWLDQGFAYAVAGAVPETVIDAVARSAYKQILAARTS